MGTGRIRFTCNALRYCFSEATKESSSSLLPQALSLAEEQRLRKEATYKLGVLVTLQPASSADIAAAKAVASFSQVEQGTLGGAYIAVLQVGEDYSLLVRSSSIAF